MNDDKISCPKCGHVVEHTRAVPTFWLDPATGLTCTHFIQPCDVPVWCPSDNASLALMRACDGMLINGPRYQHAVDAWMQSTFDQATVQNVQERCFRFLEEALELVQSLGMPLVHVNTMINYTYSRPPGEPHQELGGVHVTLNALATAAGLDSAQAATDELTRVWGVQDKIRQKQLTKPVADGPLPGKASVKDTSPGSDAYALQELRTLTAQLIHYPKHWDTVAYPTLDAALAELEDVKYLGCQICASEDMLRELEAEEFEKCEDCPPPDYPSDRTRCLPCPERKPGRVCHICGANELFWKQCRAKDCAAGTANTSSAKE